MTDTTDLLKYAEGLTWRPISEAPRDESRILVELNNQNIDLVLWDCDEGHWWNGKYSYGDSSLRAFCLVPNGQAGEIIKVLVEGLQEIAAIADCHGAGVFSDPAHKALTHATAILEGDKQ